MREFDLIVYGASGFTGQQAARYLAEKAPKDLRWAIGGRSSSSMNKAGVNVPIVVADGADPAALADLAKRARVVLNMAGPFKLYGDKLVEACIEAGTDYADISGETARIRRLIDRCHAKAEERQVKVVNFCGASSLPADLAVALLDERLGGTLHQATATVSIVGGSFNGGTIASIVDAIESGDAMIERDPFLLGPEPGGAPQDIERDPTGLLRGGELGAWLAPSPLGISDTRAVRRSAALLGRNITFQEYAVFESWREAATFAAALRLLGIALRQPWARRLIQNRIRPGTGPSAEQMDRARFQLVVRGVGAAGVTGSAQITGDGDAGNRITVACACECALALALNHPSLPARFGVLTPAVAIGTMLAERLRQAGMTISVV
ncbi:saccharopine dehydrogenase [Sphingomonas sp. AP4-R1]|uniref:saccharopine dehydrogenase family protein n=1 Tax=Sphingomonas sp. AP4-R1 TaxID=2735134 RepID=UPI001493DC2B|nr:saccharopine dehydrogenase NADP-binding domain-containing protein [Sphingomonas sp. AP4-R1]QJU57163.1 saccharopine dehydrogenase [Sphingomonas sp. AP4-R1]